MGEGTLMESIYAFIGANAWYLTLALYIVIGVCQALLGGSGVRKKAAPKKETPVTPAA